jgi:hypothetical protein
MNNREATNVGKFSNKLSVIFLILSTISVMAYYRHGGTRDFGLYVRAGDAFIHGENAYITQSWRSGSVGAVFIWFLSLPFSQYLQVWLFQLINFAGFWNFCRIFIKKWKHQYWIFGLLLFLSPIREVINTLQITGLVFGLLSLYLMKNPFSFGMKHRLFQIFQSIALGLAIDLKPHSILIVVALLGIAGFKRFEILLAVNIILVCHLGIDLIHQRILEFDWLRGLFKLGNTSGENGESTSIWKLIDNITHSSINTGIISICAVTISFLFSISRINKSPNLKLVILGLLTTALIPYMHYYDLAPLAVIALVKFMQSGNSVFGLTLIMFLILPREISSPENVLILVCLVILIQFVKSGSLSELIKNNSWCIRTIFAVVTFCGLHAFNSQFNLNYRDGHTLMTSESMIMIWLWVTERSNPGMASKLFNIMKRMGKQEK